MDNIKELIDEETINERINELAKDINKDYKDKDLMVICILKGAVFFFTDLTRKLDMDPELHFMRVSSYDGENSTKDLKIKLDLDVDIKDKDILIVEDIVDTGYTLAGLKKYLEKKEANSVKICCLLDKPERREVPDLYADYVGFVIPNRFVLGYGLDYDEKYRCIPKICCMTNDEDKELENDKQVIKKQLVKRKNILH